jgi:predicted metalloprotease with PDZ domain
MSRAPAISVLTLFAVSSTVWAQHPLRHYTDAVDIRYARSQPVVGYTLRVDAADLTAFAVEMRIRTWRFTTDGVPHRVVYWPLADATPFDTAAFVGNVERLARQTVALFGRAPYREYAFLFQDGAYGGLEHRNSVTLGAPSADLARDPKWLLAETAHEFIHTWNLMRIHPAEYGDVDYRTQPRTRGLWWSEGLTMFYADLDCIPETESSP